MNSQQRAERVALHEQRLLDLYQGPVVGVRVLRKFFGFESARSFQIAARCERLPVPTFFQEGRRGRFARVRDMAEWLTRVDEVVASKQGEPTVPVS